MQQSERHLRLYGATCSLRVKKEVIFSPKFDFPSKNFSAKNQELVW